MDSILTSIKKLLGLPADYEAFDPDIIMYISSTWNQFIAEPVKVEAVKAYVAVKVRLLGFDVPQSSVTKEALQNTASEMEWRLNVEHDHPEE